MNNVNEATIALSDIQNVENSAYNTTQIMEKSLVSLLDHRITRLIKDDDYEQELKESLRARWPEATFLELSQHLNSIQQNNNTTVREVLTPFLPKSGSDRIPMLDPSKVNKDDNNTELFNSSSKEQLQSFEELRNFLGIIKEAMPEK